MNTSRPVHPASSPPVTSPAGPILIPASTSGWSTGWSRNDKVRWLHSISSGVAKRFDAVPFFWSQHYDLTINYVGHAESWDAIDIDGSLNSRDCLVTYRRGGRTLAAASISRDLASLEAERDLETTPPRL